MGILVALILSVTVTIPYVLALWSLNHRRREMNVAAVAGETHMHFHPDSLVNITLVAVYPKAAVEERSNMFVVHFVFLIKLDVNIVEFECDKIEINFWSSNWTSDAPTYFGSKTLNHYDRTPENLSRYSASGRIPPFIANVSVDIGAGRWPPHYQGVPNLIYLAGEVETSPNARLLGRITTTNNLWGPWTVLFDIERYPTTIYRFNFPPIVDRIWNLADCRGPRFAMRICAARR